MFEDEDQSFTQYRLVVPKRLGRRSYLVTHQNGRVEWQVLLGRRSRLQVCDAAGAELASLRPKKNRAGSLTEAGFELFRGDSQQAWIRESGGDFSDRFTVTMADRTETRSNGTRTNSDTRSLTPGGWRPT